ncbi:MAG: tetratricopeptide repeat protein [Desulfuromonadales bacterium]|nr:MAG: tetratricopeptide repeat protein [Desulfuromonadales bacterium]
MKKETILAVAVALVVGLLGGYLVFSISGGKSAAPVGGGIPAGGGSPVDYQQRIVEAEKIVARDPKNLQAWIQLGNDYFDTEQAEKSINAYGKALELDPNNANVLTDQGIMLKKVKQIDKAIANFEKAQSLDPKHLQSLYNLGVVYMDDLKQPDKAIKYWSRYLELDPTSPNAQQIRALIESAKGLQQLPAQQGPIFKK